MASCFFFFGTLRDLPLLEVVLGGPLDSARVKSARLPGWLAHRAAGETFPVLRANETAVADGIILKDVRPEEAARLDYYELGHGYRTRQETVDTDAGPTTAVVYFAPEDLIGAEEVWDFAGWQGRWAEATREAAREVMGYLGEKSAEWVAQRYSLILARAQSRISAGAARPNDLGAAFSNSDVEVHSKRVPYADFFTLETYRLTHPRFDGGPAAKIDRAAFVGFDAALCLPYDPKNDRVLLVEQFRVGAFSRADARPWLLEPVAGLIDPGEDAEDCCRREAQEEAGIEIRDLHSAGQGYASPGANSGFFHMFVGLCDLPRRTQGFGGLADEGEDIRTLVIGFDELMAAIASGEINVIPLQHLAYWLALHRPRLRAEAGVP
ncbi:MAG: NUDIX domain-containing protein [Pseudomonadota bacterium]